MASLCAESLFGSGQVVERRGSGDPEWRFEITFTEAHQERVGSYAVCDEIPVAEAVRLDRRRLFGHKALAQSH